MNAYKKEHDYTDRELIDMIDEIYGEVDICGFTCSSGEVLKDIDPDAFWQIGYALAERKEQDNPIWICSECESEYENEAEAENCCEPETDENE